MITAKHRMTWQESPKTRSTNSSRSLGHAWPISTRHSGLSSFFRVCSAEDSYPGDAYRSCVLVLLQVVKEVERPAFVPSFLRRLRGYRRVRECPLCPNRGRGGG